MADDAKSFMVEDARIIFRNFAGGPTKFNAQGGKRTFAVVLDDETANTMLEDGWNVKWLDAREEGDEATAYIQVVVNFNVRPPRVVLLTSGGRTQLDEGTVDVLDFADIMKVDLIANGYDWEVNGKRGTAAYLKSLFVTIEEDALELKYKINENPPS